MAILSTLHLQDLWWKPAQTRRSGAGDESICGHWAATGDEWVVTLFASALVGIYVYNRNYIYICTLIYIMYIDYLYLFIMPSSGWMMVVDVWYASLVAQLLRSAKIHPNIRCSRPAAGWLDVHSDGCGTIAKCFAAKTGLWRVQIPADLIKVGAKVVKESS